MTEQPQQHASSGPEHAPSPPGTPSWVKALAVVLAVLVLLVLAKALFGGGLGGHGPAMHAG